MFFKNRYIAQMEARILELEKSLRESESYKQELIERLLRKEGVPAIVKPIPTEQIEGLLRTADVFSDIEDGGELEDNRKEPLDAFAS